MTITNNMKNSTKDPETLHHKEAEKKNKWKKIQVTTWMYTPRVESFPGHTILMFKSLYIPLNRIQVTSFGNLQKVSIFFFFHFPKDKQIDKIGNGNSNKILTAS